ncbi:hypothetical protein BHE74_00059873, partial [Ensete ventricosum]
EQFYPWAPLVAIEDSTVNDLYVELVATFNLKRHTCSDLVVEEVICAACIDENGEGLLFKKSSNFHRLRVRVAGQRVHCVVDQLDLFLYSFIFGFEAFFRWFAILILYWFNHEKPTLFAAIFSAPCFSLRDFFGLGDRPMLNSAKMDRIFSSIRLSKASNLALMASSDAMVYASRSIKRRGQGQGKGQTDLICGWVGRWRRVSQQLWKLLRKVEAPEMATRQQERGSDTRGMLA